MTDTLEHQNFREQIGDYLAGGLTADQKAAFESHARACDECGLELKSLKDLDHELMTILEPLAAPSVLEDRIAERLSMAMPKRKWISPIVRKSAVAVAAIAVVSGVGWVGRSYLVDGKPPQFAFSRTATRQIVAPQAANTPMDLKDGDGNQWTRDTPDAIREKRSDGVTEYYSQKDLGPPTHGNSRTRVVSEVLADSRTSETSLNTTDSLRKQASASPAFSRSLDANDTVLVPDGAELSPLPAFKPAEQFAFGDKKNSQPDPAVRRMADRDKLVVGNVGLGALDRDDRPSTQLASAGPKIIREGSIEFEVDSFDNSFVTIQKVVGEEGGFVAAVDSDKMTNGKVRGTITLRVPPQNLDTLVMKLRSLGDLKTQRLGSTDISKQYTDLEGQLRAARAMEERLLDLIKNANGKVKDLLEAENQLGEWRQKIETVQGQLNFFNNRVSLATLTIIAAERNVNTPASATRHEQITAGVETNEVEHGRAEILKVIDAAKGRIIESSLQQLEAGQLSAKIVADVPSDSTGPIADRLHQLGSVTRYDAQRSETVGEGDPTTLQTREVKDQPTRLIFSLYNVANVAPRTTTNLSMVSDDVEGTYRTMLKRVTEANGRLITSNLTHNGPRSVGELRFEVKTSDADGLLNDLRSAGQVIALTATENPDSANVTTSKQGFVISLSAAEQLSPKQTRSVSIQTGDVGGTQQRLLKAIETNSGKIITSNLTNADGDRSSATITADVSMPKLDALLAATGPNAKTTDLREDPQTPAGPLARARVTFIIASEPPLLSDHQGIWGSIRSGFATSAGGLLWSLEILTIGLCLIAPWAAVVSGGWWLIRKRRRATAAAK